jgi:predicted transcriptional regulator
MQLDLTPELQAKLNRLADERGLQPEALVQEAVERLLESDDWFLRQVEFGLAEADHGDLISHDEVRKRIEHRYP